MIKMTNILTDLKDIVFPKKCLLCQEWCQGEFSFLCTTCQQSIHLNHPPFCHQCSRPLSHINASGLCAQCQTIAYAFDRAWGSSPYTEQMKHLIHLFKYKHKTVLRHLFKSLIVRFINEYHVPLQNFDFLIPVPLHPLKLREREYNQSEILAQTLSTAFQHPVINHCLTRVKSTRPQALLTEKERWTNVHNAFRINQPSRISDRSVLIIDDLMTTGATVCEIAKILKKAGARYVGVLTLSIA